MKTLELSRRLSAVADCIPQGTRLADIGTDHAYLPVSLILSNHLSHVIVTDLRLSPLEHAKRTAAQYGVSTQIDFRLCAGLEGINPHECDTISISGMGGEVISKILQDAPWTKQDKLLILQPQSTQEVLRTFLADNGYRIIREAVVREEGRWYVILTVQGGDMRPLSPAEHFAGMPETWVNQSERVGYLRWLFDVTGRKIDGLTRSGKAENRDRLVYLQQVQCDFLKWISRLE